jgi:hypothetical protein
MLYRPRACIPLIVALLFVVPPVPAVHAEGAMMQVEPFFSGHFKYGEWLPLHISLTNDGPSRQVQLRADTTAAGAQTTFVTPVELPAGARKRLTLYVLPPSFARAIRVRLMDGEEELESRTVDVTVERNVNYLVGVVAARAQAFTVLNNLALSPSGSEQFIKGPTRYTRATKMIPMPLADIPDRPEGLRALDALVVTGVDTSELSPAQKSTLATWVAQGGRLILGGGTAAGRTLSGMPEELVKEYRAIGDVKDIASLTALARFAEEEVRVPGPFPVTWAPAGSRVLVEQEGNGLLVEKRIGQGYVDYSALDLASSPFDAWAGAGEFWIKVLAPGSAYPQGVPPDVSPRIQRANAMSYALQNMPALELPSIAWLGSLLGIYLLLVGPANYLILRRWRKLAWGWVTIPALTLLFSVGAFAFAYYLRGGDVIIHKISVLNLGQGEGTPVQTYVGIFSPERSTYNLSFKGLTLIAPMAMDVNPFGGGGAASSAVTEIVEGEPTEVRGIQVNQFAMQGFTAESPVPEGWGVESDLTVEEDRLRGTLVNHTNQVMASPVIVFGNHLARLDDLLPGERRSLDQKLQQGSGAQFPYSLSSFEPSGPTGPSREAQVRQQLLSNYFQNAGAPAQPPSRPTLVAWMRTSPLDVQITGTRWTTQQMSLVVAALNTQYAPGHIRFAPRDLIAQLVESQGNVGICGPYNQILVNSGSVVLEFQLPDGLADLRITRLALVVQGGDAPTVEVADRRGEWVKIDAPRSGRNELSDPTRFVSADGGVRVRLSVSGNASPRSCAQYDLDVEGDLEK